MRGRTGAPIDRGHFLNIADDPVLSLAAPRPLFFISFFFFLPLAPKTVAESKSRITIDEDSTTTTHTKGAALQQIYAELRPVF